MGCEPLNNEVGQTIPKLGFVAPRGSLKYKQRERDSSCGMHGSLILGSEKADPPSNFKQGPKMVDLTTLPSFLVNKQERESFTDPNVV